MGDSDDEALQAAIAASLEEDRTAGTTRQGLNQQPDDFADAFQDDFPTSNGSMRHHRVGRSFPAASVEPQVSHPPDVKDIPIEWKSEAPAEGGGGGSVKGGGGSRRRTEGMHIEEVGEEYKDPVPSTQVALIEDSEEEEEEMEPSRFRRKRASRGRVLKEDDEERMDSAEPMDLGRGDAEADADDVQMLTSAPAGFQVQEVGGPRGLEEAEALGAGIDSGGWEGPAGARTAALEHGTAARWPPADDEDAMLQAALVESLKTKEEEDMLRGALQGEGGAAPGAAPVTGGVGALDPVPSFRASDGDSWVDTHPAEGMPMEPRSRGAADVAGAGLAHEALGGISEDEREMAAMYEAALFGIPYRGRTDVATDPSIRRPPRTPFPSATDFATMQHQDLYQQWQQEQQQGGGGGGGEGPGTAGGSSAVHQDPAAASAAAVEAVAARGAGVLEPRQLVRPRRGRRGLVQYDMEGEGGWHEDDDEDDDTWRRSGVPAEPDARTIEERLIREQQDDEYEMSLIADREKEERAKREAQEAEKRKEEEEVARIAEEVAKKEAEEVYEALVASKAAAVPEEPDAASADAIMLLVRTPEGSRRSRRFLRSHKLQALMDFVESQRIAKPGTYQLVRQFPNRTFSEEDAASTLEELGLSSKQEALFIKLL